MSTRRGYFETQDDRKRLRIVKEGYNADDPNVPVNAVLFDSESEGMGSVLETGEANLAVSGGYWVRQWDYDFVPLCIFNFNLLNNLNFGWWDTFNAVTTVGAVGRMGQPIIRVSKSGIWFRGGYGAYSSVKIRWTAFRISAT